MVKKAYHHYFGCKVEDQGKLWVPHYCCNTCATNLCQWLSKKRKSMPFAIPMVWREPRDQSSICYFCMILSVAKGMSSKKKWTVDSIPSALGTVTHGEELPIPVPPDSYNLDSDDDHDDDQDSAGLEPSTSADPDFQLPHSSPEPHHISQGELNDLVRDFELPKSKAELLGSRRQQWNLSESDVRISLFCNHQKDLVRFFLMEGDLVYCNIDGMMAALRITHDPDEWRLFIDSPKTSLKAVLIHNGNFLPSIPTSHAVHMKETYDNMKQLLRCIKYEQHQWQLCGDFKVAALFLGLQGGYTKYCCFFCEWDCRARESHDFTKV